MKKEELDSDSEMLSLWKLEIVKNSSNVTGTLKANLGLQNTPKELQEAFEAFSG